MVLFYVSTAAWLGGYITLYLVLTKLFLILWVTLQGCKIKNLRTTFLIVYKGRLLLSTVLLYGTNLAMQAVLGALTQYDSVPLAV